MNPGILFVEGDVKKEDTYTFLVSVYLSLALPPK